MEKENSVNCPKCGVSNNPNDIHCRACGDPLKKEQGEGKNNSGKFINVASEKHTLINEWFAGNQVIIGISAIVVSVILLLIDKHIPLFSVFFFSYIIIFTFLGLPISLFTLQLKATKFNRLGVEKCNNEDYHNAIICFENALFIKSKNAALHFNLALMYSIIENKEKVLFHLHQAAIYKLPDFKEKLYSNEHLAFIRNQPEFVEFEKKINI